LLDLLTQAGLFNSLSTFSPAPAFSPNQFPEDPHVSPETFWDLGDVAYGMDIELTRDQMAALRLEEGGVAIKAAALTFKDAPANRMRYQYRIDNGFLQSAVGGLIPVPFLPDGKHTIRVSAIDPDAYLDATPAQLHFAVDRLGPAIGWVGDKKLIGQGGDINIGLNVHDIVSLPSAITVDWRVDDGQWNPVAADGVISTFVKSGAHALNVRAVDENGNQILRSVSFNADGGFGCSAGSRAGASDLMLLLLAFVFVWRGRYDKRHG